MRFKNQKIKKPSVVLVLKPLVKAKNIIVDPVTRIGRLMCFHTWEQRPQIPLSLERLSGAVFSGLCQETNDVEGTRVAAVWPPPPTPNPTSIYGPRPQTSRSAGWKFKVCAPKVDKAILTELSGWDDFLEDADGDGVGSHKSDDRRTRHFFFAFCSSYF